MVINADYGGGDCAARVKQLVLARPLGSPRRRVIAAVAFGTRLWLMQAMETITKHNLLSTCPTEA